MPCSFHVVFDNHNDSYSAIYIKRNTIRKFFEDFELSQVYDIDTISVTKLEDSLKKAILLVNLILATKCYVKNSYGTMVLTTLVLGWKLLVTNVGDFLIILCQNDVACEISQIHRPSYLPECKRIEEFFDYIEEGYLNGYLSITRALGDWNFESSFGSTSPLMAKPYVRHIVLMKGNEILIVGCDGNWDVMSTSFCLFISIRTTY
ncbi:hypothetical protein REPUB_Repub03eG0134500 [Reevesia pubescens]